MNSSSGVDIAAEFTPVDDQRLHIVITNLSESWGGTEHYAVRVAAGLQNQGHDVYFLWGNPVVGERVAEAQVPGEFFPLRNDADLGGVFRLARLFRSRHTDAVLLTKWREYWLGGLAAKLAGVPNTVHSLGLRILPKDDLKRRLIFRLANQVVVNADEIRSGLLRRPWIDPSRVQVVHNGVDLQRYRPGGDGTLFRREISVPDSAPLVGTIGAMSAQKDHDLFVRTAVEVLANSPGTHFTIVGDGSLRPEIEARIAACGLQERFHLAGFRRDVRSALAAFDVFVLSSFNEGMAWVLLEAIACGLPVVATDVSGTRACIEDGVNGLVVPPRDQAALANAVSTLLNDDRLRVEMGRQSRRIAQERFAEQDMLNRTLQILRG